MIVNSHKKSICFMALILLYTAPYLQAQKILDHEIVLNQYGKLQPWTSYDKIIGWSMAFLENCPTKKTKFGDDPLYLITAKLNTDGTFRKKQNNQGSNVYWAVETLRKYYAYSGNRSAFKPVQRLIDRVIQYHTPLDWAWPRVPRTQDDTPDGEYTDEWSGADKICMVAVGYINYYKLTGEKYYLQKAVEVAKTVLKFLNTTTVFHSPLPFRVNLKTGEIIDPYTANMIPVIQLIDALINLKAEGLDLRELHEKQKLLWQWIFNYPVKNNRWSGYYEDVSSDANNFNQQIPMETARYILQNPALDPDFKNHIPSLVQWVRNRFGKTKHYGATSICEQDSFLRQMSSHTARYASIVAMWYGISLKENDREEARASFALSTYSAYNRYSKNGLAINYVGIEYEEPWFSDSYWDYLSHFFDGMAELPEMLPDNANHMFYSSSIITDIDYGPKQIEYRTYDLNGTEKIKLLFKPIVYADGIPMADSKWHFGEYRGIPGVLTIERNGTNNIRIMEK